MYVVPTIERWTKCGNEQHMQEKRIERQLTKSAIHIAKLSTDRSKKHKH